jgi:hypothetical protein
MKANSTKISDSSNGMFTRLSPIIPLLLTAALMAADLAAYFFAKPAFIINIVISVAWILFLLVRDNYHRFPEGWRKAHISFSKTMEGRSRFWIISICVLLFCAGSITLSFEGIKANLSTAELAFEKSISDIRTHLAEYLQDYPSALLKEPLISGKLVVVDVNNRDIHYLMQELPSAIQPKINTDVNEIIQIAERSEAFYKYTDGAKGFKRYCDFKIVDYVKKQTIYTGTIEGTDPPASKTFHGSAFGSDPIEQLKVLILAQERMTSE